MARHGCCSTAQCQILEYPLETQLGLFAAFMNCKIRILFCLHKFPTAHSCSYCSLINKMLIITLVQKFKRQKVFQAYQLQNLPQHNLQSQQLLNEQKTKPQPNLNYIITMSISKAIPQFAVMPFFFTQDIISAIQRQVSTPDDLKSILASYVPTFPPCKAIPIVKEQYFKNLIQKQPVQQSIINLYSFMTQNTYTIEEKTHVSNLVYKLIYFISEISMTKEKWKLIFDRQVTNLALRFHSQNQTIGHLHYLPPVLTVHQAQTLKDYIKKQILPFYEIWQKIIDQNQYLVIDSQPFEPIKLQQKSPNLSEGKKLQTSEILALNFLKQYLSDKPPAQQKKDPKKK